MGDAGGCESVICSVLGIMLGMMIGDFRVDFFRICSHEIIDMQHLFNRRGAEIGYWRVC